MRLKSDDFSREDKQTLDSLLHHFELREEDIIQRGKRLHTFYLANSKSGELYLVGYPKEEIKKLFVNRNPSPEEYEREAVRLYLATDRALRSGYKICIKTSKGYERLDAAKIFNSASSY